MAKQNPAVDFIFVGPYKLNNLSEAVDTAYITSHVELLEKLDNVFFMGPVPSKSIINWLNHFDINLVLYREDKRNIIINPHKMMGYFYSGKITICS